MNNEVQTVTPSVPVVSNEEKIKELEERVARLEKIEKDRRTRRIIAICIKAFFYIIMIVALVILITKLKAYYDQLTNLKNGFNFDTSSLEGLDFSNYLQGLFR